MGSGWGESLKMKAERWKLKAEGRKPGLGVEGLKLESPEDEMGRKLKVQSWKVETFEGAKNE